MAIIAIVNPTFNKGELRQCDSVPRIGDSVDMWYRPLPIVKQVVWWPNEEMRKVFDLDESVDVVVVAE